MTYLQAPTQPKEARPPCECNVRRAKKEIAEKIDDVPYACGLELSDDVSEKETTARIGSMVDSIIEDVRGVCGRCRE